MSSAADVKRGCGSLIVEALILKDTSLQDIASILGARTDEIGALVDRVTSVIAGRRQPFSFSLEPKWLPEDGEAPNPMTDHAAFSDWALNSPSARYNRLFSAAVAQAVDARLKKRASRFYTETMRAAMAGTAPSADGIIIYDGTEKVSFGGQLALEKRLDEHPAYASVPRLCIRDTSYPMSYGLFGQFTQVFWSNDFADMPSLAFHRDTNRKIILVGGSIETYKHLLQYASLLEEIRTAGGTEAFDIVVDVEASFMRRDTETNRLSVPLLGQPPPPVVLGEDFILEDLSTTIGRLGSGGREQLFTDMANYMVGDMEIYGLRSYRFKGGTGPVVNILFRR